MNVKVFDGSGGGVTLHGLTTFEAKLVPYTNTITGESDPMVVFAPKRFIHLSTCAKFGYLVKDELGQPVN